MLLARSRCRCGSILQLIKYSFSCLTSSDIPANPGPFMLTAAGRETGTGRAQVYIIIYICLRMRFFSPSGIRQIRAAEQPDGRRMAGRPGVPAAGFQAGDPGSRPGIPVPDRKSYPAGREKADASQRHRLPSRLLSRGNCVIYIIIVETILCLSVSRADLRLFRTLFFSCPDRKQSRKPAAFSRHFAGNLLFPSRMHRRSPAFAASAHALPAGPEGFTNTARTRFPPPFSRCVPFCGKRIPVNRCGRRFRTSPVSGNRMPVRLLLDGSGGGI